MVIWLCRINISASQETCIRLSPKFSDVSHHHTAVELLKIHSDPAFHDLHFTAKLTPLRIEVNSTTLMWRSLVFFCNQALSSSTSPSFTTTAPRASKLVSHQTSKSGPGDTCQTPRARSLSATSCKISSRIRQAWGPIGSSQLPLPEAFLAYWMATQSHPATLKSWFTNKGLLYFYMLLMGPSASNSS